MARTQQERHISARNGDRTIRSGVLPAGFYTLIEVEGDVRFAPGVRFDTLRLVSGHVRAAHLEGMRLDCSGRVDCTGDLSVRCIEGHGLIHVGGDLWCDTLRFTGSLDCKGQVEVRTSLELNGRLLGSGLVEAERLRLEGVMRAKEVDSGELEVGALDETMIARLHLTELTPRSRVDTVRGNVVEMARTSCGQIVGGHVTLTDGSSAELIQVDDELCVDGTSTALLVKGNGRRVYVRRA